MTLFDPMSILEGRLRAADSVLACLDMRQMTPKISVIVAELKEVLEQGITEENFEEGGSQAHNHTTKDH